MSKTQFLKELTQQLSELLPLHLHTAKKDFEKSCHRLLNRLFTQFDLVTREEFDAQTKVLLRTRKRLEELDLLLKELEKTLPQKRKKHHE